jgi:hypothetical protein
MLGFIPQDYKNKRCYEEKDLADIWAMLYFENATADTDSQTRASKRRANIKEEDKTIKAENLFIFLAALLNIKLP